jgi:signal transduction histidine kinase
MMPGGVSSQGGRLGGTVRSCSVLLLAVALLVATGALVWLGYRATSEWRRSTSLLVERRTEEVLALLAGTLNRDMKGALLSVLVPLEQQTFVVDPPYDLADVFARAFTRFPYPESFFVWKHTGGRNGVTYFFNRADRRPSWDPVDRSSGRYPVVILRDPASMVAFMAKARAQEEFHKPFALFEWQQGADTYQAVVHLLYYTVGRRGLYGLAGFTVNLSWVRRHYFGELLGQVDAIGGKAALSLAIVDENGQLVDSSGPAMVGDAVRTRAFPLIFFDPALVTTLSAGRPPLRQWTMQVSGRRDLTLAAATRSAERTFLLVSLAALAVVVGLVLTVRATRMAAQLATLRSDFVSAVTHELKTPLSLIRLVGETLEMGRYSSPETVREYAVLLSQEAGRLTRLIDNLLTYARINNVRQAYNFSGIDLVDLVEDGLEPFRLRLADQGFDVSVEIPVDLPRICADRLAMLQVLENLIDNAIKYSDGTRALAIRARETNGRVRVDVVDRGTGIPEDEVSRVFDQFFRGRDAKSDGSGLGLAIARRIVQDHQGVIEIHSVKGEGTAITLTLPTGGTG